MEWTYRKEVTFDTVSWKLLRQSLCGVCSQHSHVEPADREDRRYSLPRQREKRDVWAWEEWPEGRGQTKGTAQGSVVRGPAAC